MCCGGSVLCGFIIAPIDRSFDSRIVSIPIAVANSKNSEINCTLDNPLLEHENLPRSAHSTSINDSVECEGYKDVSCEIDSEIDKNIRVLDCFLFPEVFWILVVLCIVIYGCIGMRLQY